MNIQEILKLKKTCSKQELFSQSVFNDQIKRCYIQALKRMFISNETTFIVLSRLVSIENKLSRNNELFSSINIRVGDICEVDFGDNYINESGFQHLAIVLKIVNKKAFVVPLTSNTTTTAKAYYQTRKHLMYIGKVNGLNKESSIFLNDARYISLQRIIGVKGHIPVTSRLFSEVKQKVIGMLL